MTEQENENLGMQLIYAFLGAVISFSLTKGFATEDIKHITTETAYLTLTDQKPRCRGSRTSPCHYTPNIFGALNQPLQKNTCQVGFERDYGVQEVVIPLEIGKTYKGEVFRLNDSDKCYFKPLFPK